MHYANPVCSCMCTCFLIKEKKVEKKKHKFLKCTEASSDLYGGLG